MKIQICISTMNNTPDNISKSVLHTDNTIVINQVPTHKTGAFSLKKDKNMVWYDFDQVGLSRSRNLAIQEAKGEFIYLTDDDIELVDEFNTIVSDIIKKYDCDVYAFKVEGSNGIYKEYPDKIKKINNINSQKLSSVQLIFRREFLISQKILFDENFGTGSIYRMGEENILLSDAIKSGAKVMFFPETIGYVELGNSSWFKGFNEKYFFDRGAIFTRIYGNLGYLFASLFIIRKRKIYKNQLTFFQALSQSFAGIKDYQARNK